MTKWMKHAVILRNIGWGLAWGCGYAVFFSVIALLIYLFGASTPFQANRTTLPVVLLAYLTGGLIGGVLVGLLRPLNRWKRGAALMGLVGASAAYSAIGIAASGWFWQWNPEDIFAAVAAPLLIGPALGVKIWKQERQEDAESQRRNLRTGSYDF